MNVLVIGDEHTYGYGLRAGQLSYINHFVQQLSRSGQTIRVEAYAHLPPIQMLSTLAQLPLHRYDLILVQTDEHLPQPLPVDSVSNIGRLSLPRLYPVRPGKQTRWRPVRRLGSIAQLVISAGAARLRRTPTGVDALLKRLKPYRHTVVLLTPLPQRIPATQWLRNQTRARLAKRAGAQVFSLFDTGQVVKPREEYFLSDDPEHLNAVSHELLGRALFDFYQSAPSIVTIQTFRRDE